MLGALSSIDVLDVDAATGLSATTGMDAWIGGTAMFSAFSNYSVARNETNRCLVVSRATRDAGSEQRGEGLPHPL